jgi:hypothetical protein
VPARFRESRPPGFALQVNEKIYKSKNHQKKHNKIQTRLGAQKCKFEQQRHALTAHGFGIFALLRRGVGHKVFADPAPQKIQLIRATCFKSLHKPICESVTALQMMLQDQCQVQALSIIPMSFFVTEKSRPC